MSEPARTPRAQQILDDAVDMAQSMGHSYVGTEHLILAILADPESIPTQIMQRMGLDVSAIWDRIAEYMQTEGYKTPQRHAKPLDGTTVQD